MHTKEFRAGTITIDGTTLYTVYRLRDAAQPDDADNREIIVTCADERIVAEGLAATLNDPRRRTSV